MTAPGLEAIAGVDPSTSALLIIDMQNAFCHADGTLGISGVDVTPAQATYPVLRRLVAAFADAGLPVLWTRQVHLPSDDGRARKALAAHTAKRKQVSAVSGSWDAGIVDELADLATDPTLIVTKHRFGSFYETRLRSLLDMLGVSSLFVTGVTANACVETTIREAYLRDYDVVAVTDAIAAVRPKWAGVAEQIWAQYFGVLATSDDVCAWLAGVEPARATRLHHLLLEVADLDRSLEFYRGVLGFTVRKREEFRDGRELVVTHQGLGLTTAPDGAACSHLEHVCFSARRVDEIAEKAAVKGHRVVRGPGPGPYGHTVYLEDPDGNEVELFEHA
ncbi:MAG: isochorismatase family protein [Actinomycetota bacterium]|nr:isochorismatase family protein [Actinomycetota bacterium]